MAATAIWLWPQAPARAGDVLLGNVLPGGGIIRKNVATAQELAFSDLIRQRTDFSCGAAALATILTYAFGMDVDEITALRGMFEYADEAVVREKGFSLLDLKTYAEGLGMQSVGIRLPPKKLSTITVPTIVMIDYKGYKHFVVLKLVRKGKVYIGDPALGNKVMRLSKFARMWNGIVLVIYSEDFDKNTVLRHPAEELSARRLLAARVPGYPAEPLGFGTEHFGLFRP